MSIQNNTAVDVYQNFVLPTALDSDFSNEDLADDMEGLQLTMQRVKIPGGGNLQFEIRGDDPDNPDYERKLVGVILHHHFANAVTRFSQDVESYDRATQLEEIGYSVMTMSPMLLQKINQTQVTKLAA